jgi:hypothetical protein
MDGRPRDHVEIAKVGVGEKTVPPSPKKEQCNKSGHEKQSEGPNALPLQEPAIMQEEATLR